MVEDKANEVSQLEISAADPSPYIFAQLSCSIDLATTLIHAS